ncbi:MAG: flippase-like domain-containing protein [Deltaproteobacteria bacterium]|nr:flippase-like domain-containing protein [Deltaproteobacteria bacterium]
MKKTLIVALKVIVSSTIMYLLLRGMDMRAFLKTVVSVSPFAVIGAMLFIICIQCVSTLRWSIILKKDVDVPYLKLFSIYFIGMFFNNFLPTLVGGDIIKGYYLYKASGKGGVALASVFMDRYAGFSALIVIALGALIMGHALIAGTGLAFALILLIFGYAAGSLILWVDLFNSRVMRLLARVQFYQLNEKIDKFYKVLMSYRDHRRLLLKAFFCSLIVQAGVIVVYYFIALGLGMKVPMAYFFLFIPLTTAASMLPISVSGLGIREGVFVFLFTKAGATEEQALSLSLIFFFIAVFISLIGAVEYIRSGTPKGHIIEEEGL